ncbi:amidohydrolase [uncultured Martelella sp.]|uniref:amidohydrolase n=1 Tax=uncultured Martelella sp. TaxID=392331 RepID=UPI0029C79231|nr:amidohydrolase [uncultured Martelella sp.]
MDSRDLHNSGLSAGDIAELTAWRRDLHRTPELSGEEARTAEKVVGMLEPSEPDRILTGMGGHGVAAVYAGSKPGPSVLLRCELDALPIAELNDNLPHRSQVPGTAHLCGHDGHMAMLVATARWLGRNRPSHGRVILLFQPAEEDGSGAKRVIEDPRFSEIQPDFAFALHNWPGLPLGHAILSEGPAHCASRGMKIVLTGRTAHASQPETGLSPASALALLIEDLETLCAGEDAASPDFARANVTHARLGEAGFGTTPGDAELHVTLRTQKDDGMALLVQQAEDRVTAAAARWNLRSDISYHDIFRHCENAPEAVQVFRKALAAEDIPLHPANGPVRGSEDFGRFGDHARSALLLLGAGLDTPDLHNPDFDFPDELIPVGARLFAQIVTSLLD